MRRIVTTCDRCKREVEGDALYRLYSTSGVGGDQCHQPFLSFDLCGYCYSRVAEPLANLVTTDGATVLLPA